MPGSGPQMHREIVDEVMKNKTTMKKLDKSESTKINKFRFHLKDHIASKAPLTLQIKSIIDTEHEMVKNNEQSKFANKRYKELDKIMLSQMDKNQKFEYKNSQSDDH